MLKVTQVAEADRVITLKLEGRIVGEWVDALMRECTTCLDKRNTLILDLSPVSFVDNRGIKILNAMKEDRVQLIGCSLFLSELLKRGDNDFYKGFIA